MPLSHSIRSIAAVQVDPFDPFSSTHSIRSIRPFRSVQFDPFDPFNSIRSFISVRFNPFISIRPIRSVRLVGARDDAHHGPSRVDARAVLVGDRGGGVRLHRDQRLGAPLVDVFAPRRRQPSVGLHAVVHAQ